MDNKKTLIILSIIFFLLVICGLIARYVIIYKFYFEVKHEAIMLRQVAGDIANGKIDKVVVNDDSKLEIYFKDGIIKNSIKDENLSLEEELKGLGVANKDISNLKIETKKENLWDFVVKNIGPLIIPLLVLFGALFWLSNIIRRMLSKQKPSV